MQIVDSHCHLDFPDLAKDQDAVVQRARAAGVSPMLTISTHYQKAAQIKAVAERFDDVFCTIGVHPDHVADAGETVTVADLVAQANHPKVIGLGETGLDYFYRPPSEMSLEAYHARQEESFRTHLQAGRATGLPVIIHSRQAEADTARIMAEEGAGQDPQVRGVMHCFSSGRVLAEDAVRMGFYISLSGILTFKKSDELRAIAKDVPLEFLLVETDAPFLAPHPLRGQTNEPALVVHTAAILAEVKGVTVEEIARITTENFYRLFSKATQPTARAA
jgi:TatD DNase family protein